MKLKTIILLLLTTIGLNSCSQEKYQDAETNTFAQIIADTNTIILDVRTPEEFNSGHIAGAKNIDVKSCTFIDNATQTLNQNKTIAVYCRSGKRSANAAAILSQHGFTKIVNLKGGIIEWQNAGKPIEK